MTHCIDVARSVPRTLALALLATALLGCSGRTELFPNSDPALRKSPAQFAADAARRFPYPSDLAPGSENTAAAQVDYGLDELHVRNLTGTQLEDVEIWVNREYVVYLPVFEPTVAKIINFRMLFNEAGEHFPLDNNDVRMVQLELVHDGKLHPVVLRLRD